MSTYSDELKDVYPPVWYVEYKVEEVVPGLGTLEKTEHLEELLCNNQDFVDKVESDPSIFQHLKQGLNEEVSVDESKADEIDKTIEAALLNRAEFAARQLQRVVACEPFIKEDKKEKQRIVHDVFQELCESVELLKAWGSEATLDAFAEKVKLYEMAVRLGNLIGIDLLEESSQS